MIDRKKIILLVAGIIIVVGSIVASIILTNRSTPPDETSTTAPNTGLSIENFSTFEDISVTDKVNIKEVIDRYLADAPRSTDPIGIVRDESYKKTTDGSITTIEFIVDIASLKRSYKINLGSDSTTDQHTLYVLCPTSVELIYPPFNCKDDLSET